MENVQKRILIVDDDPLALKGLMEFLQVKGYLGLGASSGEEALKRVRLDSPDLVLLDLVMPGMDGLKVLGFIKKDPLLRTLPVILLTSRGEPSDVIRGLREGADDYVVKPVHQDELLARVQAHLRYRSVLDALEREKSYVQALYEITRELSVSRDYQQILQAIVRRMAALLDVHRCSIILTGGDMKGQVVASSEDLHMSSLDIDLSSYPEIIKAITSRQPVIIDDVGKDPTMETVRPILAGKGIRSIMVLPILRLNDVVGVLFLRGGEILPRVTEENLKICQAIASATAPALSKVSEIATLREEVRLKERYEFLFSHASDGLLTIDSRGRIGEVSDSLLAITGFRKDELHGQPFLRLVADEGHEDAREIFRKFLSGRPPSRFDIRAVGKGGGRIVFSASAGILPGEEKKALMSLRDVTEERRLAQDLERTMAELKEREKEALIAELTGAAAHELNQPLTAILGITELILKDAQHNDPRAEKLKGIAGQAERMAEIVKKIGRITRYETKSYAGGRKIFDLETAAKLKEQK